ncbi:Ppx/GppA phosphatase family protein [Noviherbaspirillum denitrificans]|uniref:Exopolyphosphatase n=1 Tax=Noviherbaspirillum denitrificans TaxID=1968433 RepID=A0A254THG8_9BURK|nr:Ppx/GppA phosphatase family protein [Noviherbaspirillum denitrificans]OWW20003.1 exopolyphosphatase [Noviherbaspirillum denitrificans]
MFAAVDLGSNSFRLHVGKFEAGAFRIVKTARDPVRLGAGLDSKGNLTEQAKRTALESLKGFRAVLNGFQLDAVRVVATNTLRIARNAAAFLPEAEAAIGYPIEIISGEEEGRLIYMGVASKLTQPTESRLVIDIGGGSTELILGQGQEIRHVESFSIGTVGHSQSFFPDGVIDDASVDAAILSARSVFEDAAPLYSRKHWTGAYGSSGTMRAISDGISKNAIGDGTMSIGSLQALRRHLVACGHISQVKLAGVKPERVVALTGGLAVLIGIMQELDVRSMTAVDAGLRMGVLWDLQLRANKLDRRDMSVRECMRRFHVAESRASQVAQTAATFFGLLKPASDALGQYVGWSAMLHEIGQAISHTGYHKHGAYMVENADLPGFTAREQRVMSTLVVAQKGNLRKLGDVLADPDFAKAVLALRLAVIFLHSRIEEDVSGMRLKMKNRIDLELRREWLDRHPTLAYWIEKERSCWEEVGVEMSVKT